MNNEDQGKGPVLDIGYGENSPWTQMRIRKYYRNYLRDLGKLYPLVRGGIPEDRSMSMMVEHLITEAGGRLVHNDMGANFSHTPDPWCGCSPVWPPNE